MKLSGKYLPKNKYVEEETNKVSKVNGKIYIQKQ